MLLYIYMLGKLKISYLVTLTLALLLGSVSFINWVNYQSDFLSQTLPNTQLAQVYPIPVWTQPNPEEHVLIVYNNNLLVPDSVKLKDYYIKHRPGFSNANVLGVNTVTTLQDISEAEYNKTIRDPIVAWLQENKKDKPIRYIVMMYGLPTRIPNSDSIDYRVSTALQSVNLRTGMEYKFPADIYAYSTQFTPEDYSGTTALVTRIDMGTPEATKAYIDKIVAMCNCTGNPKIIISPSSNTGTYYFDDARGYKNESSPPGRLARDAILGENPSASIDYHPNLGSNVFNASNVKGYMSWGAHASLGDAYANDGSIKFSGNSGWYIIQTIESYNGVRFYNDCGLTCQGSFVDWFAANAFGGTNYENTPIGAVVHVQEPGRAGVNTEKYFGLWERGYLFAEAAWASGNTPQLMVIGDPLITSHPSTLNATKPIPTATLTADPASLSGTSGISTLKWSSTNAQFCTPKGGTFGASLGDKIEIYGTWRVNITSDITYSLTCRGTGGTSPEASLLITIDKSPVISSISASLITTDSATISWSTTGPVTSQVLYGDSTGYGSQTTASNLNTQILTGLRPNTTYHYQIKSTDSNNNVSLSPDKTFDTLRSETTIDTTPPSVPTNALAVLGSGNSIKFSWNGSNDTGGSGVAGYKLYRNDIFIKNTTSLAVYDEALPGNTTCWSVASYDNKENLSSRTPNSCVTIPSIAVTSFTVYPTSIVSGQSATLSWTSDDAVSCTASDGWTGTKATSGTQNVTPTVTTTYSIMCKTELAGNDLKISKTITITAPTNNIPALSPIGQKSVAEGSQLNFTISGSDNDLVDTLTYSASNLPIGATFNQSTKTFSFTPTYTQSGSYATPTFTVSDGKGGTDSETITITVSNTNRIPVANAGTNQAIILPATADLSSDLSSDPDAGTTLKYTWSKDSGPGTVVFSTPNAANTTATFSTQGTYVLKIIVSDDLLTGSDTITVAVNQPLPADNDNDGIINTLDKCSNTPDSVSSQVNTLGCPEPKTTKFTASPDMNTTDLNSVTGFELTNRFGSIEFTGAVSLIRNTNQLDIDLNTNIFQGGVSISSTNLPELNKPARITLNNINVTDPIILKDGIMCSQCTEISYSNNTYVFSVPSFSTYTVISNTPTPTAVLNTSPTTITAGNNAVITWSSTNSSSCIASDGWTGTKTTSGTQTVTPAVTTTYSISCGGSSSLSPKISKTIIVTPVVVVTPDPTPDPEPSLNNSQPLTETNNEPTNLSSSSPVTVYKLYRNFKLNDQGDDVLLLQQTLNKLGFTVTENSIFDKQTSDAVLMYQENKTSTGINPTGNLDNTTIILLNYDISNLSNIVYEEDNTAPATSTIQRSFIETFIIRVSNGFNNFVDLIIRIL